jgi:hypothetical protein
MNEFRRQQKVIQLFDRNPLLLLLSSCPHPHLRHLTSDISAKSFSLLQPPSSSAPLAQRVLIGRSGNLLRFVDRVGQEVLVEALHVVVVPLWQPERVERSWPPIKI